MILKWAFCSKRSIGISDCLPNRRFVQQSQSEILWAEENYWQKRASDPDNQIISLTQLSIKPEQKFSDRGMLQGWDRLERFFKSFLSMSSFFPWYYSSHEILFLSSCSSFLIARSSSHPLRVFLLWSYSNDFFHPINSSLLILTTLVLWFCCITFADKNSSTLSLFCWQCSSTIFLLKPFYWGVVLECQSQYLRYSLVWWFLSWYCSISFLLMRWGSEFNAQSHCVHMACAAFQIRYFSSVSACLIFISYVLVDPKGFSIRFLGSVMLKSWYQQNLIAWTIFQKLRGREFSGWLPRGEGGVDLMPHSFVFFDANDAANNDADDNDQDNDHSWIMLTVMTRQLFWQVSLLTLEEWYGNAS